MKTLVDSSVWIGHFKKADSKLISLLEADEVFLHPFIIQELYLGKPKGKDFVFERLAKLPCLSILSEDEFRHFVDGFKISGKGIGVIDCHLLGVAYQQKIALYTLDKRLDRLAQNIL
ncbi:MAG TPA: PIN domain-containing protein [Bdellovibrio sp.]|nr:PIN domain-containing protein [Bdellovibrio sp.]